MMPGEEVTKLTYMLMGLDCAHCAAKLEGEIRKIAGLSHININFVTKP